MKFFVDTAEIDDIRQLHALGLVDGVTTNPSLIRKSGKKVTTVIEEICHLIPGPVSAEVRAMECQQMLHEAEYLLTIASNICIKLPLTFEGLKACRQLSERGVKTNVTLCFSANQALLAAKAGATYISPFIGRLDDLGLNGMDLIGEMRAIYDNYHFKTEILAASIRTVNHVKEAALIGADVATVPPAILRALVNHPLTEAGLANFNRDWQESGQTII